MILTGADADDNNQRGIWERGEERWGWWWSKVNLEDLSSSRGFLKRSAGNAGRGWGSLQLSIKTPGLGEYARWGSSFLLRRKIYPHRSFSRGVGEVKRIIGQLDYSSYSPAGPRLPFDLPNLLHTLSEVHNIILDKSSPTLKCLRRYKRKQRELWCDQMTCHRCLRRPRRQRS